jgi:ABC-2 type transport system ATP-binding protein
MTDERTPEPEERRGLRPRRLRPRPTAGTTSAGTTPAGTTRPSTGGPNPGTTGSGAGADGSAGDPDADDDGGNGGHPVRPWEVPARETTAPGARPRRRRTVADVLAEVPDDAVIVARRLTKRYGDFTAVDSLDLTIRTGEVFGLLGPNGAGKTTTVLMLLGLTEPTRGLVRVIGLDPTREPLAVKRKVGYLPDNVGFYGGLSGRENLRYTARLNGIPRREAEDRIAQLLHDVRLDDAADKRAETYSRGMRQRLGIADALVKDPSVLVLDEPTIAIDPSGVEELLGLIRRLVTERQLTVLLSSHILGQVQSLCDRVGFFAAGRLVAAGPLDELARGTDQVIELEVAIDGDPAAIDPVARTLPAVRSVEPDARDERLRIVSAHGDVAASLASALAANGLSIVHLRRRGSDLLELYRRYVPEVTDGSPR